MRDFIKSTRFKVLLAFLAFLVGIMVYAVTKGGYSVSGASFINTVTKPFRAASNSISAKMERTVDKLENADKYYEENERLKKQIGELNAQLTEYDAIKAEVEELRKFVTIKENHDDYQLSQPCKVLSYVTNDPFKSFTIDKGSADGILVNCPVVTAEGLVGITVEVSKHLSTVRTILSPDLSVAAVASSSNADQGIIEGDVLSSENGHTKLIHVPKKNKLKRGDLMITAGSSGLFPKDYPIGTILEIGFDSNGLSVCADINPCVDVSRLTSVIVITDFSGKKEDEEDED
ncbi:MAG: rod shape-determining protein MreC [Ruminococcus sp.]|uniref:rod shape-determining protein MreC n=1 Tax=Ruminococcus sp. TaxID=41978 RepID=UPI001B719083|nr:rod shape-determining protein MreC [Ruminococcus sp.]MBO4493181.1 rod shape-determining protein MreC [Ruminococcus sp.]MBP5432418.1 rod shape-determining protein MreC [Ruminococcus sp.]